MTEKNNGPVDDGSDAASVDDNHNTFELDNKDVSTVDVKLFKAVGLYHLLQMGGTKEATEYYRRIARVVLSLDFALQSMQLAFLYFSINDLQQFTYLSLLVCYNMLDAYKCFTVLSKADRIRDLLSVTRYGFADCGPGCLVQCRHTLVVLLRTFFAISHCALVLWAFIPLVANYHVSMTKIDGTVADYRLAVYNYWVPMSEETYNWWPVWMVVYLVEAFLMSMNVIYWLLFDVFFMNVCFTLNAQYQNLISGFEELGHLRRSEHSSSFDLDFVKKNDETELENYNKLISLIKDSQKITLKLDEFYDIVRPCVIVQVTIGTYSIVTFSFLLAFMYVMGWSLVSGLGIKYISGLVSTGVQTYIYCFALNFIEMKKEQLNFGLYSSNWTEMNLKFKKTLLIAMKMNSAHKRVLKGSPKNVINLEMFSKVINVTYSIVSVLLNSTNEKKAQT